MDGDNGHVDSTYLDAAAQVLAPVKLASDRLLDIGPGASVLDVGCGPGADALRIAEVVGPGGRVLGVDADPAMVEEARTRVLASGLADRVQIETGSATQLPLDGASVDACRSDRVLMHVGEPQEAVNEMARVTKPGGRVVCVEPDWATLSIDCESTDVERRLARFTAETALACGFAGRRLQAFLAHAGLTERRFEVHAVCVTDYGLASYLVCFDRVHAAAARSGLVTQAELDRLYDELERADRDRCFYGSLNIVAAMGTKPPA